MQLFCVFEFSGAWASVGEIAGHNSRILLPFSSDFPFSPRTFIEGWAQQQNRKTESDQSERQGEIKGRERERDQRGEREREREREQGAS